MRKISEIKPFSISQRTNKAIADQGYTYNEAGLTYNEAGVEYGGLYDGDILSLVSSIHAAKTTNMIKEQKPVNSQASDIKPQNIFINSVL